MNIRFSHLVATAPTVYGIETGSTAFNSAEPLRVATAPTVYGIETTANADVPVAVMALSLQQRLPFTVLKLSTL